MAKKKKEQKLTIEKRAEAIVESFGGLTGDEYKQAMAYAVYHLPVLLGSEEDAKNLKLSLDEYIEISIHNGISDKEHLNFEAKDIIIEKPDEQEIEEVDLNNVKKALQSLLTHQNDMLKALYQKHAEYNEKYFHGTLSHPLITIDKLNNRTLGNYTHGADEMGITNHIRFNRHFIALNDDKRIFETLVHEMIHQWQDEILYASEGNKNKTIKVPDCEKTGSDSYTWNGEWKEIKPKKRPKDWHNRDFKEMAVVVNIPAKGDKCYGNRAKMPEPKSYNRKFICNCVASNGHPVTVWCTRKIFATCNVCGSEYIEVPKGGNVIRVKQSHVEKPGEDAIRIQMKDKYTHFEKFTSKDEKDAFMDDTTNIVEEPISELQEGVYQKNHNAYKEGFRYWVAYNTTKEVDPDPIRKEDVEDIEKAKKKKKASEDGKSKAKGRKQTTMKVEKPKAKTGKIVKTEKKDRSHKNPVDIIELYKEHGTIKAVAEAVGKTPATIIYQKKKFKIDFDKGVYVNDEGQEVTV